MNKIFGGEKKTKKNNKISLFTQFNSNNNKKISWSFYTIVFRLSNSEQKKTEVEK